MGTWFKPHWPRFLGTFKIGWLHDGGGAMLLDRIVQAHQAKQAAVSEMILTPKINAVLAQLRQVATNLIVLHGPSARPEQTEVDNAHENLLRAIKGFQGVLNKLDGKLKGIQGKLNPGQRAAIERTRQNLMRAFK